MHMHAVFLLSVVAGLSIVSPGRGARKCFLTDSHPAVPMGLELCYMHSHKACCLPGFDKDIRGVYSALVPNGQGCMPGSHRIYSSLYALREYLCLPCDPQEALYRFESVQGDMKDGGLVPPSANSAAGEQTWRICRSFLYGKAGTQKGLWGRSGSRYDECGIIINSCLSTPVFNVSTGSFESPSSSCKASSELTIPSITFRDSPDPALEMLSRVPQSMPQIQIVIVDDSDPNYDYDKTPCFGRDAAATSVSAALSCLLTALALSQLLSL
ncbi:hypothetical protein LSCM1_01284 [Leishmania martiniquensis]|uniref:Folate receptor-like domain-containing protein n=1 Tax=Leishmania martiniquensis TaxID=1580590 RepID=A0A836GNJ2_9TRYP|nr:hypothetical protein LSCM1_01284 [Leishmania martiniquensis]